MATSTTTFAAIRDRMVTTIKALTPAARAGTKYVNSVSERADFRDYAEDNDASVFRQYDIENIFTERPNVEDLEVQLRRTECEVVVAYPHHWGTYTGTLSADRSLRQSMKTMIEQDLTQIAKAIGVRGSSNYVAGQHAAIEETWSTEEGDGVTFGVLPMAVTYYAAA